MYLYFLNLYNFLQPSDKFRIKCRFRACVRKVIANAYWLIDDEDYYEGDDVKRRVEQAVSRTKRKKELLSIHDKALLCKPASCRTDSEKRYLYRIIGNFKCFRPYPKDVKKELAAVAYFNYFGPGRTIVRENQEAHAIYFIVSGDVTVSHMEWDEVTREHRSVDIGTMHPGDMFGEVSLLHNIPRTASCTTTSHCELLVLRKDDFKTILQTLVQEQWDDVETAMSCFTYFDSLDALSRREGCIVAKLKSYKEHDTIYGDGKGIQNFVYFVLSGHCQMIESLQILVRYDCGRQFYTLYDPYVGNDEDNEEYYVKYFRAFNKENDEHKKVRESTNASGVFKKHPSVRKSIKSIPIDKSVDLGRGREGFRSIIPQPSKDSSGKTRTTQSSRVSGINKEKERRESGNDQTSQASALSGRSVNVIPRMATMESLKSEMIFKTEEDQEDRNSTSYSESEEPVQPPPPPKNLETFFMQVCLLNQGATFGFGENMRDRRIVALTPVYCMLLPKVWLLQRNTANIWTRIQYYLHKRLPTKKQLFNEFVSAQQWQEFKNEVVEGVVNRNNTVNWTSVHDVPYSVRMEEMVHI